MESELEEFGIYNSEAPTMYVSRRAGHQKTSTTDDIYTHVVKADGVNLSEVFHSILDDKEDLLQSNSKG